MVGLSSVPKSASTSTSASITPTSMLTSNVKVHVNVNVNAQSAMRRCGQTQSTLHERYFQCFWPWRWPRTQLSLPARYFQCFWPWRWPRVDHGQCAISTSMLNVNVTLNLNANVSVRGVLPSLQASRERQHQSDRLGQRQTSGTRQPSIHSGTDRHPCPPDRGPLRRRAQSLRKSHLRRPTRFRHRLEVSAPISACTTKARIAKLV